MSLRLDLPPLAVVDAVRNLSTDQVWCSVATVGEGGVVSPAEPVADGVIPVNLPDDYRGRFEVHLISEAGVRLVVAEGRRLPPLPEDA